MQRNHPVAAPPGRIARSATGSGAGSNGAPGPPDDYNSPVPQDQGKSRESAGSENTLRVEARSYEIDPYGHLNNAVYANWLEHARLCFLSARGLTYLNIPELYGVWIVVVRTEINYRAQVRLGDRLDVKTALAAFGKSSFRFTQTIDFENGLCAADALVTMVCIDKEGNSAPMPPVLRAALESAPV